MNKLELLKKGLGRRLWIIRGGPEIVVKCNVILVSTGGVGSTNVLKFLQSFVEANAPHDEDELKHLPCPPKQFDKIIYVSGDVDLAAASVVRRGFSSSQIAKLGGTISLFVGPAQRAASLRRLMRRQASRFMSLSRQLPTQILIVDYEQLWDSAERIAKFLDIRDPGFILDFPKKLDRSVGKYVRSEASVDKNLEAWAGLKFAVLEQSGTAPSNLSLERRASCGKLGISYFRLSWNPAFWDLEDPETLLRDGLTWSEGRSVLFAEAQRADFDYFIFIDDDVRLARPKRKFKRLHVLLGQPRQLPMLRTLVKELATYLPLQATVYSPTDWAHSWDRGRLFVEAGSRPFRIAGHDLQVDIFHKTVASLAYPAPVAGSGGSMFFAHFVGAQKWPEKQIVIKKIWAYNEEQRPHGDSSLPQFERNIVSKSRSAVKPSFQDTWVESCGDLPHIIARNKGAFKGEVAAGEPNYTVEELWYEVIDRGGIKKLRKER